MDSSNLFRPELNQVLFEEHSRVRKVILNRPRKFNSLTDEMVSEIYAAMEKYENDSGVELVIFKGSGKAFCAGGDAAILIKSMLSGHWTYGARFYRRQFMLDYLLATSKKPLVFFINGFVMGGGAGLSMNATFRIVTENAVFAMPEAILGLFPDAGASYFLNRLPRYYGEYLGLTGARIDGTEMLECGLATHYVLSKDLHLLENSLCDMDSSDMLSISNVINKYTYNGKTRHGASTVRLEIIKKCFSRDTVEEIILALEGEIKTGADKWVIKALASLKAASPASLKTGLRSIREGRMQNLEECLTREYTVGCNMFRRTVNNDFYEGVRASLLDKDKKPKWEPSELCHVSEEMVDKFFQAPHDDDDWEYIKFPVRSGRTHTAKL